MKLYLAETVSPAPSGCFSKLVIRAPNREEAVEIALDGETFGEDALGVTLLGTATSGEAGLVCVEFPSPT